MPFYEYECQACKYYTEVMQKLSDAPLSKCPSCGKRALRKLVSAPVFRLKGAGWYETDFKSDQENKRNLVGAEKEEPKADKPESKDGKGEAKEAAKPAEAKGAETKGADAGSTGKPAPRPTRPTRKAARPAKSASARRRPRRRRR